MSNEQHQFIRYIRYNGYQFLACALVLVLREGWFLARDVLYGSQHNVMFERDVLFRSHTVVRWIATFLWLLALTALYGALKWQECVFVRPAKYMFLLEAVIVLVKDFIRTIDDEASERFIKDKEYLFYFTVVVVYVMYTFHILEQLFEQSSARGKHEKNAKDFCLLGDDSTNTV